MRHLMEECRTNFQKSQPFSWQERMYHATSMPQWCYSDSLKQIYSHRGKILKNGRIVWGHIVQANAYLYCAGKEDLPAAAVYSLDPHLDDDPKPLEEMAEKIYKLKGKKHSDEGTARFANLITNELARPSKQIVPDALAENGQYFLTTVMVLRKHMPFGFLSTQLLPLVVAPGYSDWTFILPARYWPTKLIDR